MDDYIWWYLYPVCIYRLRGQWWCLGWLNIDIVMVMFNPCEGSNDPRSAISQNIDIISIISNFQECSALVSDFGTDTYLYIYIYSFWTEKNNQRPQFPSVCTLYVRI